MSHSANSPKYQLNTQADPYRAHRVAPVTRANQGTFDNVSPAPRAGWTAPVSTRDDVRAARRAHVRNNPQPQFGAVALRLIVGAGAAVCGALLARGAWHAVANALQAFALHGGF